MAGGDDSNIRLHTPYKVIKPLMEKRRRARINESLARLKLMVMGTTPRKPGRPSKLDKADILEMTVEHLQRLHNNNGVAGRPDMEYELSRYVAGFNECVNQVLQYLNRGDADTELRLRVLEHLSHVLQNFRFSSMMYRQQFYRWYGDKMSKITTRHSEESTTQTSIYRQPALSPNQSASVTRENDQLICANDRLESTSTEGHPFVAQFNDPIKLFNFTQEGKCLPEHRVQSAPSEQRDHYAVHSRNLRIKTEQHGAQQENKDFHAEANSETVWRPW